MSLWWFCLIDFFLNIKFNKKNKKTVTLNSAYESRSFFVYRIFMSTNFQIKDSRKQG